MKNVLSFQKFRMNEDSNLPQLEQQRDQIQKQITDLQKKLLDINQQILNGQRTQLNTPATAGVPAPAAATTQPSMSMPQYEGLSVGGDGKLGTHVLEYGLDDGVFWIGTTDNIEDDINVPEDEWWGWVENWAKHAYGPHELEQFNEVDDSDYTGEDGWTGSRMEHFFDTQAFWDSLEDDAKRECIQWYLKTKDQ